MAGTVRVGRARLLRGRAGAPVVRVGRVTVSVGPPAGATAPRVRVSRVRLVAASPPPPNEVYMQWDEAGQTLVAVDLVQWSTAAGVLQPLFTTPPAPRGGGYNLDGYNTGGYNT